MGSNTRLGVVLVRIIRTSPVAKFNFDDVEESGWKTLHGDVFRPPRHFMNLSVIVGCGAQLLSTAFVIICTYPRSHSFFSCSLHLAN
jgi:hypothetical protein